MRATSCVKAIAAAGVIVVASLGAQERPQFDVAAIRERPRYEPGGFVRYMPDGGIRADHMTARRLISVAYQLEPWEVSGAPPWAEQVCYDIDAKPQAFVPRAQTFLMMQHLLEDRFGLTTHRERREIDAFALVRVRPDRLGDRLKISSRNCTVAPLPADCPRNPPIADEFRPVGAPLSRLVGRLSSQLGVPVADETQLEGLYDIELTWTNDPAATSDRSSLTTALQEQLGLRLERRRVSIEVLVVDRFQRPTPN